MRWWCGLSFAWVACVYASLLALVACHGPVHRPGEEYLDRLRFEGNHAVSDGDLKAGLALERTEARGGAPDPYSVAVDTDRVRGHYARLGFLDADVRSRMDRAGLAVTVVFTIEEGPRAQTRIDIQGLPPGPAGKELADKVRDALPLADGDPFDYAKFDQAKPALVGVVEDAGYAHVKLDAQIIADRATHRAVVSLVYETGPICKFGEIKIEGIAGDLAQSIDQRESIHTGDRYSTSKLAETQRAIYAMNRFSTVRITPDKSGGDVIPITISVARGASQQVTLGGGFGIDPLDYEARLRAGYQITGWPAPLYSAGIDVRPAYALLRETDSYEPRIRALASLQRMDFLFPFVTAEVAGGYNYLVVEAYTTYGPIARLGITTPLGTQRLKLRAGWRMEYDSFRDVSPLLDATAQHNFGLDTSQRVGAYEETLSLDLRDNPLETRAGAYFETKLAEGTAAAGGALDFFEAIPEARAYVPIYQTVLAARVRVGGIWGDIPVTERFYAGGASSNRGFGERQLAPTFSGYYNGNLISVPFGGTAMIDTSFEARQLLGTVHDVGIGGVVFLDGGDVTETWSELDPHHLNWATGLGIRALTIVGAVRADFGVRLNRTSAEDPEPGSRYAFHLSLGEAF